MHPLLLSVIVPVYNAARFLPQCLDSLLGQTYMNLEIICVDDGSTDDSLAVLKEYAAKDERIKVMHQENAGVSAARNRGLALATGELITFVDADDWLEPDAYESTTNYMQGGINLVCFGTKVESCPEGAYKTALKRHLKLKSTGKSALTSRLQAALGGEIWNKIFRRSIIELYAIRFPEALPYGEDKVFYFCYAAVASEVFCTSKKLLHYRVHETSAMAGFTQKRNQGEMAGRVFDLIRQFYEHHNIAEESMQPVLSLLYEEYLVYALAGMNETEKSKAYAEALQRGVIKNSRRPEIFALRQQFMPAWEKRFHYFSQNRECFGIIGKTLISITYETNRRVYRILGRTVCIVPEL